MGTLIQTEQEVKKWTRGRTMFSEGHKYISNNEYIPIIAKTNLDTGEITVATLKEAKRFLTEEDIKNISKQNLLKWRGRNNYE